MFSPEATRERGLASVRLLLVDDGSSDATARLVAERIREGLPARLIRLSRNFGHQSAVCAGLDYADADLVVVMDADLQDPPEVVWEMLAAWRQGADVAFGRRRRRKGNVLKRLGYWGFYRLVAILSDPGGQRDDEAIWDRAGSEILEAWVDNDYTILTEATGLSEEDCAEATEAAAARVKMV